MQADEGVVLSHFKCFGQPRWLGPFSQPWTATALVVTLGEEPMEEEKM